MARNGEKVPNWLIINSDIRRLERICCGKVPDETDDLQALILEYDENFLVLHTAEQPKQANEAPKTKAVNPVVALWEQKGVSFPGKGHSAKQQKHLGLASVQTSSLIQTQTIQMVCRCCLRQQL